jgi:peptide deformylase
LKYDIRDLVKSDDPILITKTEPFDFDNPPIDPSELAHILAQNLIAHQGIGLAAPQIGLPYRACVLIGQPMLCMINPRIVDVSEKTIKLEEGCLTFPGLVLEIERPEFIKVRYSLPNGEVETKQYVGLTSRIVQHEVDHLNGVLFTSKVSPLKLALARKKAKKWQNSMKFE